MILMILMIILNYLKIKNVKNEKSKTWRNKIKFYNRKQWEWSNDKTFKELYKDVLEYWKAHVNLKRKYFHYCIIISESGFDGRKSLDWHGTYLTVCTYVGNQQLDFSIIFQIFVYERTAHSWNAISLKHKHICMSNHSNYRNCTRFSLTRENITYYLCI